MLCFTSACVKGAWGVVTLWASMAWVLAQRGMPRGSPREREKERVGGCPREREKRKGKHGLGLACAWLALGSGLACAWLDGCIRMASRSWALSGLALEELGLEWP